MEPYQQLETEFGAWVGVENVIACASGTAALHLALESLQLPPSAGVILPDYTMVACARAVALAGLRPIFVDCGPDLLMDPELLELAAERYPAAAIMAVHVYSRRCAMGAVHEVAGKYDLKVVEDLAEAHGVPPDARSDAACWSFYRNKIIAGEEGGAVAFRDSEAAILASQLRSLGFTAAHDFVHVPRGHNYRMSNAHAAAILTSLRAVEANLFARRRAEAVYDRACPPAWRLSPRDAPWVYDLRIPGLYRETQLAVVRELNADGVAARVGFWPMSRQPEFRDQRLVARPDGGRTG